MVQFCWLRLYSGIDCVSRRLLQWIAKIKKALKRRQQQDTGHTATR